MNRPLAIVLAAGKGTRMKSDLPKVLVKVCGRPMIDFVLDALAAAGVKRTIVVVGYREELVRSELAQRGGVEFVTQTEQKGTGHAVMMCRDALESHNGPVVVVAGDSPLLQSDSLRTLLDRFDAEQPACILGTGYKDDPTGLGRIVRDDAGEFVAIVEQKDASENQRKITEINLSTYVFDSRALAASLDRLNCDNAQGEYYLTDCPRMLLDEGRKVLALNVLKPCESLSINTPDDLLAAQEELQRQMTAC
jgi:bifunctional UDP-N-acetylglucosamine pyrophosphorylase/glucosamine-1-phosphate N-acetyltransferase/UDP-N-acetylglucosamine pyrophosphorylase